MAPRPKGNALAKAAAATSMASLAHTLAEACAASAWCGALEAACALSAASVGSSTGLEVDVFEGLQSALMCALAAIGGRVVTLDERAISPPPQAAETLALLCDMLAAPGVLAAETALVAEDLFAGLLCAAAAPLPRSSSECHGHAAQFAALRGRRAAGELLAALLEDAPPELRGSCEEAILASEKCAVGATRLAETLVHARPDPRLHEVLLELLWRGLRRSEAIDVDPAGAAGASDARGSVVGDTGALSAIRGLLGDGVCQRLRALTAEEMLEWGRDLALDLNRNEFGRVVNLRSCSLVVGSVFQAPCVVTASAFGLDVVSALPTNFNDIGGAANSSASVAANSYADGAAESPVDGGKELCFEVPWDCASLSIEKDDEGTGGHALLVSCNSHAMLASRAMKRCLAPMLSHEVASIVQFTCVVKAAEAVRLDQLRNIFFADDVDRGADAEAIFPKPPKRRSTLQDAAGELVETPAFLVRSPPLTLPPLPTTANACKRTSAESAPLRSTSARTRTSASAAGFCEPDVASLKRPAGFDVVSMKRPASAAAAFVVACDEVSGELDSLWEPPVCVVVAPRKRPAAAVSAQGQGLAPRGEGACHGRPLCDASLHRISQRQQADRVTKALFRSIPAVSAEASHTLTAKAKVKGKAKAEAKIKATPKAEGKLGAQPKAKAKAKGKTNAQAKGESTSIFPKANTRESPKKEEAAKRAAAMKKPARK